MNLIAQRSVLTHQIAPVACQQAQRSVNLVKFRLDETKAVGGRAMDGAEVGIVGLVSRVGRQAKLLGGQRVNDSRFKLV